MEIPSHIEQLMQDTAARDNYRACEMARPSFILKPRLSIDGDQWCALYGENLMNGVAGFGDSPDEAYKAFDTAWHEKLSKVKAGITL